MQVEKKIKSTEAALDVADLTIQYGLQSFRYGKSNFIAEVAKHLEIGAGDVFFDLGSGYGEPLFYLANKFKKASFTGIEIVKERFDIAVELLKSLELKNVQFIHGDILKEDISAGNLFYIFNPLFKFQYPLLSKQLRKVADLKKIRIIAEATACDYFNKVRWLSEIQHIDNDAVSRMKIYESK